MSFTFSVLKLDRSRLVREWQSINMEAMPNSSVTFSVLKLEMSRLARLTQSENIVTILVTFSVLKVERSRLVNIVQELKVHPLNG